MKFKLYREYGALNSTPVFNAFEQGIKKLGLEFAENKNSIPVLWSALWYGRMKPNQRVFEHHRKQNLPVIFIEVGNLCRGKTWRISLNNVNRLGIFGNQDNIDYNRPKILGFNLKSLKIQRKFEILIAGQHQNSLQWGGQPPAVSWILSTIDKIKKYTDRPIVVRPHPRSPIQNLPKITIETPKKIVDTYDDFDINYNYHCVVNYNSGPSVQAAINGTPIVCDFSSLAYPVSDIMENIDNPTLPDRELWFTELCYTEWTIEEIAEGIPLRRLIPYIEQQLP